MDSQPENEIRFVMNNENLILPFLVSLYFEEKSNESFLGDVDSFFFNTKELHGILDCIKIVSRVYLLLEEQSKTFLLEHLIYNIDKTLEGRYHVTVL